MGSWLITQMELGSAGWFSPICVKYTIEAGGFEYISDAEVWQVLLRYGKSDENFCRLKKVSLIIAILGCLGGAAG